MSELELKFEIRRDQLAAVTAAVQALAPRRVHLISWYYDTADRQLAAHKVALRLRKSAAGWEQTLKGPGANPVDRLEENADRPGRWGHDGPDVDPTLHAGSAAGKRLAQALAASKTAALCRTYVSDFQRDRVLIEHQGSTIELALDQGHLSRSKKAIVGEHTRPLCELEFELKSGEPAALFDLARDWSSRFGLWLSTTSKAAHGDRLANGQVGAKPVTATIPAIQRDDDGPTLLRKWLACSLEQILGNASEIAAGDPAPELIHQLRVGVRRLRTVWREMGAAVDPKPDFDWQTPVITAFRQLGELRDRDSAVAAVHQRLHDAGCPPFDLPSPTRAAYLGPDAGMDAGPDAGSEAGRIVREPAFQQALLSLLAFTLSSPASDVRRQADRKSDALTPHPVPRGVKLVRKRLTALRRKLIAAAASFESADEPTRHAIRKRLKRLRYLAELAAPLFEAGDSGKDGKDGNSGKVGDAGDSRRFLKAVKAAQTCIGDYHDQELAAPVYRQAAEQGLAPAWYATGWLAAQRPQNVRACRNALRKAAAVKPFW